MHNYVDIFVTQDIKAIVEKKSKRFLPKLCMAVLNC